MAPFAKAHDAHHGVFQSGLPHPLVGRHRGNLGDLVTQREAERIRIMDGNIRITPPPASGRSMRQPCRCGGR